MDKRIRTCLIQAGIGIHEIGRKDGLIEIGLEIVNQGLKLAIGMVVADSIACSFPGMLLRVQVRTGRGEEDHLQAVSLLNQVSHFTKMPGGAIQQEEYGL